MIISFFRDFLSGPLYIVVAIISAIGIIACIGYLAEATLKQKELEKVQNDLFNLKERELSSEFIKKQKEKIYMEEIWKREIW